ncbi:MAG: transcriptional regulator [Stomatobaculum sp.]|nr:transcriptional regulator [Stomatobaculum sp.]
MKHEKAKFDVLRRIEKERDLRRWSDYTLAANSDIPQSTISTWRSRNLQPSLASIEKICGGLGITLSQFFSEENSGFSLNEEQKRILILWNRLSLHQKKAVMALLESFLEE